MRSYKNSNQKGFTLIELLVVIAIIGLLSSVVLASLSSAKRRARVTESLAELRSVNNAIMAYYAANGTYPSTSSGWNGFYTCPAYGGVSGPNYVPGVVPSYIPSLPREPLNNSSCNSQYLYNSNGTDYKLIYNDPEDCTLVKKSYPNLLDPIRDCGITSSWYAYGYWSPGGATLF